MTKTQLCAIIVALIVGIIACAHVSASDVAACQEQTGWSAHRCLTELTR
jgi:uncharacterized protein YcnI